jgi:hypothetical protein
MTWKLGQVYVLLNGQWQGFSAVEEPDPPIVTDGLGYIGDDLTLQGGSTQPQAQLVASGWDPSLLRVDAAVGRTISGAADVITDWREQGFDPDTWIIALGSFDLASTDPQWTAAITAILDQISAGPGAAYTVYWPELVLRDSETDTRVTRFEAVLNTLVGDHPKITFKVNESLNAYIHNGRTETGLWVLAGTDATGRLMTSAGYDLRNKFITAWVNGATIDYADPDPPDPAGPYTFDSSAIEGGGFQNAIAVSPFTTAAGIRPYIIGADVAGVHRSTDRGANWAPASVGSLGTSARIAAIMWSATTAGKVFVAEDGGIHRSLDWGSTWARRTSVPDYDANGDPAVSGSPEHPRQTGYLMAQSGSTYWCGSRTQGLKRSTDEFATFADSVLEGHPIRSIAKDPNADVLYVCVNRGTAAQNGFWRVTGASGTMVATKLTSYPGTVASPIGPEEVLAVDQDGVTHVYVAGHESGMFKYLPGTSQWFTINSGLTVNGTAVYRTVCADPENPEILYCGHWHPSNRRSIYRSANSGATWAQISAPTAGSIEVSYQVFGHSYESFLKDIAYHSFSGPNADWLAAMITIDPDVPNRVLVAGRGGAWWGTLSGSVRTWRPAVRGLMVTVMMAVEADQLVDGRVLFGNMDYTSLYTTDAALNSVYMTHASGASSTGDVVAIDQSVTTGPGRLYVGASTRGQSAGGGKVWSSSVTHPAVGGLSSSWVDESGAAFTGDVVALGVGATSAGTRVILAGVSGSGFWRKVGTTWSKVTNGPLNTTGTNMGVIRWRRNSPVVYVLGADGLWRSGDAGSNWVRIYGGVSATYGTYDALVLDPSNTAKLYVSSGGVLRRIDNASTTSGVSTTTAVTLWSTGGTAGNIAVKPDGTELILNIRDGRLMRSTTFRTAGSQAASNWVDIATPLFQRNSGNIRSLAMTPSGIILTADNGGGTWRGRRTAT